MSEQITPSKKISIGFILSWIFGIFFAIVGFSGIVSGEPIPGILMLIMAAVLLPPINKLVDEKWKFHLSGGMKAVVIIIGFIIFGSTIDTSGVSNTQQTEIQEEQITNNDYATEETNQIEKKQPQAETEESANEEKTEPISTSNEEEKVAIPEKTDLTPTQIVNDSETESAPESTETVSQRNALRSAKVYLEYSAFSYSGLIEQLEYEKFSNADAVYGADNSGADWFEQAAKSAESYMEYSPFSRGSLIEQLKYEGFTQAQAEHGADAVGL